MIAVLIAVAIILIMAVIFLRPSNAPSPRKDNKGYTTLGLARLTALDATCQNDLQEVRTAIANAKMQNADDAFPASLADTKLGPEFMKCPVGGEAYVYDPATGHVHCPHPGHEKY